MKYIVLVIILTIAYVLLCSLMKAASKTTPSMQGNKHNKDRTN
ncbi:hypothetical protein [Clostridium estertheticum]|nr:hypothetical protein [Clostridium estertheticum]